MPKKALIIGIDSYRKSPLSGCVNDANRVTEVLGNPNCGFQIHKLTNKEASRQSIRREIEWLFDSSEFSILYFSGHGLKNKLSTYLVSWDFAEHDEGIDFQYIAVAANKLAAKDQTVLIILDCCHSGDGVPRDFSDNFEPVSPSDISLNCGFGRIVMAACRGTELAFEYKFGNKSHGAFTHYFCEAMSGYAADHQGDVTINRVFDFISYSLKNEGRQIPVLKGEQEGSVIIAKGISKIGSWHEPDSSIDAIRKITEEANSYASRAHLVVNPAISLSEWKNHGYEDSSREFEPILKWFTSKFDAIGSLSKNASFMAIYDSVMHSYKKMCDLDVNYKTCFGTIVKRIGSGGFGTVWRVDPNIWGKDVCFKTYHGNELLNNEKVRRFRRGFDAMKQLNHPNIVQVLQFSDLPLGFFMTFIDGANLRDLNPGTYMEPDQVIAILIDVAETIKHAHDRGVIHRDIKPENIIITTNEKNENRAYLTDFDLAWFTTATQLTKAGEGFGSHFYAAPEQINSPNSLSSRSFTVDTYSFGQLLFFAVSGRDPQAFSKENNERVLSQELTNKWSNLKAAQEILKLYSECNSLQPKSRISDFREIAERLAKLKNSLQNHTDVMETSLLIEQIAFSLVSTMSEIRIDKNTTTLVSRTGRTEYTVVICADSPGVCNVEIFFRPEKIKQDGQTSASARKDLNQKIDDMTRQNFKTIDIKRHPGKSAAFESTLHISRVPKTSEGVLLVREIAQRTLDIIETH